MAARQTKASRREGKMSLGGHLVELRKRLYLSALFIVVGAVIGWFTADFLLVSSDEDLSH